MKVGLNGRFLIKGKMEGIGWFCHEVIRRLVHWYPQHEFILFFDRSYDPDFVFGSNVTPVVLHPAARHPILWALWFEISIPGALKKYNCDLYLSMDGFGSLNTDIRQFLVIHDLAYIHYPEQMSLLVRKFYQYFVPKYIKKAEIIFTVSQASKDDIIKQFKLEEEKIEICFSGVKECFKPMDNGEIEKIRIKYSEGKPYFLFVGALHPRKNVHGLIRAFDLFKKDIKNDIKLMIVGRKAWMSENIEKAYKESLFKEEIIFLEGLDDIQLANLTGAALAAIAPSFLEGFGVPALEALCCDVPVLCSGTFSLPEIAGPGAILFNPNNILEMSKAMQEIVNDKNLEKRIELGRIHREQFTWDKTAKVLCENFFKY